MPETSSEDNVRAPPQHSEVSLPAAGSQCWSLVGGAKQKQQRPSVLRQVSYTASRRQHEASAAACKEEVDVRCPHQACSQTASNLLSLTRSGAKHGSMEARLHEGTIPEGMSVLFMSGLCRWPGCEAVLKDFPSFLKHLHSEHSHGDRSIAQWRLQQDIVQRMESQLTLEKQKLVAMQLHLHLFDHKHTDLKASPEWPCSFPLFAAQPQLSDGDRGQHWDTKRMDESFQQSYRAAGSAHLLTNLVSTVEYYKYNNIRPPYTYAYLIRWSILESPDKQRTLNEIYNWFTTMFFYFRHNTATWKNAVRHNLSLHKCFVRVEGGKGAVWTVDEAEYQRRKGQKYHRDCPVKWLTSYSHYCPEEP
ncbi:forkhead box protein P1 isoform X2 [Betta splendens]|uniref:Forkhead box protein P1 isoform X2 n=1 Tax=Betta splendens TaxID=158456 RepID=A0A6P7N659_BETSP|nr:forkhead box protein P1 isoform X2 [Betta splendens]